jgi:hypothetical protein
VRNIFSSKWQVIDIKWNCLTIRFVQICKITYSCFIIPFYVICSSCEMCHFSYSL